mgnify:CR=1 FL=1|jgi:branched-chain amino acid transport system permease protein
MEVILQLLINAFLLGGFYALLASGFSLIWGVLGLINLAYGSFVLLGAYSAYFLHQKGFNFWLVLFINLFLGFFLGLFLNRLLFLRLLRFEALSVLLLTFGLDVLISNLINLFFKGDVRSVSLEGLGGSFFLGEYILPKGRLLVFVLSVFFILLLYLFLKHTKEGRAIRAVSMDRVGAQLCGIDLGRTYDLSSALAHSLAMFSGAFYGLLQGFTPFDSGFITLKVFFVCIAGGLGRVEALLLGGFALAVLEQFSGFYVGEGYKSAFALLVLFLLLAFRPYGIFGVRLHERA